MANPTNETVIDNLSDVIQLDYDAIAAYKAAIERLEAPTYKAKLKEFLADHERHVKELGDVIRSKGGTPPESGDLKVILTKGQVIIAGLGDDQTILRAMKLNEDQTNSKYEDAVERSNPEHVRQLLEKGLADERRHRAWLERILEKNA